MYCFTFPHFQVLFLFVFLPWKDLRSIYKHGSFSGHIWICLTMQGGKDGPLTGVTAGQLTNNFCSHGHWVQHNISYDVQWRLPVQLPHWTPVHFRWPLAGHGWLLHNISFYKQHYHTSLKMVICVDKTRWHSGKCVQKMEPSVCSYSRPVIRLQLCVWTKVHTYANGCFV